MDTSVRGLRVRRVLDQFAAERAYPEEIRVDNGPKFLGQAVYVNLRTFEEVCPGL
ncbi:MAG: hypothetical protein JOY54_21155 [Acidobacteriaceae bacterium]|nr:hypothetical protein [Acidobacteriaceae bacterium]